LKRHLRMPFLLPVIHGHGLQTFGHAVVPK
jgi:hypothetical protein